MGMSINKTAQLSCRLARVMSTWESEHLSQGSSKYHITDNNKVHIYNMRFCPYAERTVLVMLAKNIPFNIVNINLKNKPDWFVESTFGQVPVILHKENIIPESLIGCDYLDDAFGEPKLHPQDPLQKALDRVVVEKQSGMMKFLFPIYVKIPNKIVTYDEKVELFEKLVNHLQSFESELGGRGTTFLGGEESPNMADYMIWPFFERVECLPKLIDEKFTLPSSFVHVHAWMKAMRETKPVKEYGLSPERMAKATSISMEFSDYDKAMKESAGL